MNSGAEGAEKFFEHLKWSKSIFSKYMANDDFSQTRRFQKIPFSFFAGFWVRVTSGARGPSR